MTQTFSKQFARLRQRNEDRHSISCAEMLPRKNYTLKFSFFVGGRPGSPRRPDNAFRR